jgi:hypothetical protein
VRDLHRRLEKLESRLAAQAARPTPISEETWARVNWLLDYSGDNPDTLSRQARLRELFARARARMLAARGEGRPP